MTATGPRVVVLGAGGGRTHWRGTSLGGPSSALIVEDRVYLVDFGRGWAEQFFASGLGAPNGRGFETVEAGFLTHLHADHVVDLTRLLLFGGGDGLWQRQAPLPLIGPGPRTAPFAPTPGIELRSTTLRLHDPAPGTHGMIAYLTAAFASDLNDQIFDSGAPSPETWLDARDIALPEGLHAHPHTPAPQMAPLKVYADDRIEVTAVLVDHRPMVPCFAFRFETGQGSVTFSGDTAPTPNLVTLARGSDLLVHEAIDGDWIRARFTGDLTGAQKAKRDHLLHAHTDISQVGQIAAEAEVGALLLNHLGPPPLADRDASLGVAGFAGRAMMARPGLAVSVSEGRVL